MYLIAVIALRVSGVYSEKVDIANCKARYREELFVVFCAVWLQNFKQSVFSNSTGKSPIKMHGMRSLVLKPR